MVEQQQEITQLHNAVEYISIITNSLSLAGATSITLMFILNKELRNFAFYLIFNLALCDSLYAISNLILPDTIGINSMSPLCQIQAFGSQYFAQCSILWTSIIAYTLYQTVLANNSVADLQKKTIIFNVVAYLLPLVIAVGMLVSGRFGITDTNTCWIEYQKNSNLNLLLGIFFFYVPLLAAIVFNQVILLKVITYLRTIINSSSNLILNRLQLYPIILTVCWITGVIFRITMLFGYMSTSLLLIHTFMSGLPGFFNFIAYGLQKQVQDKIYAFFISIRCCCRKQQGDDENLVEKQVQITQSAEINTNQNQVKLQFEEDK